jgi:GT2 family glycosyltransferase
VVCLYGKPEYLFLQTALFANLPGIEDYEFIYICNSPELAERLLRDAYIDSTTYDLDLTLVLLPGNAGFGGANNVAVKYARTDRVIIVNPDVFPKDQDWAAKHLDIVEHLPQEQTRIFGVPLYYDDGSLMHGGMYFDADSGVSIEDAKVKSKRFLRVEHYGKGAPPHTGRFLRAHPVPAITGAFISIDRDWFEKLNGFSEDYVFGHYEDADLCLRSIEGGFVPWLHDVKLWHLEGKGSHRLPVHEGASVVNRWLFNKRWEQKLIPDMLGRTPDFAPLERDRLEKPEPVTGIPRQRRPTKDGQANKRRPATGSAWKEVPKISETASSDIKIVFGT